MEGGGAEEGKGEQEAGPAAPLTASRLLLNTEGEKTEIQ